MLMPYQVTMVRTIWWRTGWAAGHRCGHLAACLLRTLFGFSAYKEMRRIPKEMFEAGMLDGANDWKLFLKICYYV
jgi:ABC-type glycerol-3-phosphate transport system permease component